jgi:hypothetical protein
MEHLTATVVAAAVVRQALVLRSVVRSRQLLAVTDPAWIVGDSASIQVVLPVLR